MNPADQESGIARITHGNERDARELRANLAVFARRSDNPQITRLVNDVLAGRRNVREVLRTKEFTDALGANLRKIEAGLDQLTNEERAEVWDRKRPRTSQVKLDFLRGDDEPDDPDEPILRIR
jgi:hypothetical protein